MNANLFLIILGFIWILVAVIQDLKKREVANWVNFSLIIFALTYRLFYSLFSAKWNFFIQGVIGFLIFLVLGNIFYYSRIFAGGDAKLFIALGSILPFSLVFKENVYIFIIFIIGFLIFGGIYGLSYSLFIAFNNKKQFSKLFKLEFKKRKLIFFISIAFSVITFIFLIILKIFLIDIWLLFFLPLIFLFLIPVYIYSKTIEECMSVEIDVNKLTEGDWLYEDIKINNKEIKASWEGLTKKDIEILKKYKKKVRIKQGIPFTPSFFFSFIFLVYLWYSSWKFI